MKLVVNRCYGGFRLSDKAYEWLGQRGIPIVPYYPSTRVNQRFVEDPRNNKNNGKVIFDRKISPKDPDNVLDTEERTILAMGRYWDGWTRMEEHRGDPLVVQCVEALGKDASSSLSELEVVNIPDGIQWRLDDYDGIESVEEQHRSW